MMQSREGWSYQSSKLMIFPLGSSRLMQRIAARSISFSDNDGRGGVCVEGMTFLFTHVKRGNFSSHFFVGGSIFHSQGTISRNSQSQSVGFLVD